VRDDCRGIVPWPKEVELVGFIGFIVIVVLAY